MASFTDGFWNLFIIVIVLGSLLGMYLFIVWANRGRPPAGTEAESVGHVWDGDLYELNNPLPLWWLNMFLITIIFGTVYLVLYPGLGSNVMLLGWTEKGQYEAEMKAAAQKYGPLFANYEKIPIPELIKIPAALRTGERLFASYCTQCHGADAGGMRGFPNLRDNDWLWGGTPQAIQTTILHGRRAMMPAWSQVLGGPQGVADMANYVLSLSGRKVDEAAAARAKPKFAQICAACHGPAGKGNQALGAPNLSDDIWLFGGSLRTVEQTIAHGRKGHMPAHQDFLGKNKVHLLAAYVYSLSHGR